jgi:putative ABC transport system substrate-binding protein
MRRREFIGLVGGAALGWPLVASAQQQQIPLVAFLNSGSPDGYAPMVAGFREGLREAGYVEGQNVTIEFRWAEGQYERVPAIAADLIRRHVAVFVANTPGVYAVKAATATIPIVFTTSSDPVQIGLVASLNHPGGNVTGSTQLHVEVMPKRLEAAHELLPEATVMAALINPAHSNLADDVTMSLKNAASKLGLQILILQASTDGDLESAFATVAQQRAGALVISTDAFFVSQTGRLAALAMAYRVPTIFQDRVFAAAGGLMSYGGSTPESYRLAGLYTGRILKGEKPSDLPVQQSTKLDLIVNLKTANALGLTVPQSILLRADEVFE